ncbi:DUF481 domain-containing protein [Winogradskyella sp. KYW1333]|uniref:DUF481 domain-containing protein n=1 Tax=Winogradskyella sp. KYW1333 TaxID=2282123 RepID=UPI0015F1036E|nr:DUF481 domain-containing protein [Winogradskyella sp. KYW1333]
MKTRKSRPSIMPKYILGILINLIVYDIQGQVNIESQRMQLDSVRFAFRGDVLFNYSNTNGDYLFQIRPSLTTSFKSKDLRKIFFVMGNYNLIRSKDVDFQNSWFFHIRYNQKLSQVFRLEGFIQNQNNELFTINSRNLMGAGIRLKFIDSKVFNGYFGNSYMYEIEKVDILDETYYRHRHNSYLSLTFNLKNKDDKPVLELTNTTYFQPLYSDFGNHRILQELRADMPLNSYLSLSAQFDYLLNSFAPTGEQDSSAYLSFGLSVNF